MIQGKVKLAPGRAGFFDEITRIHLSISNPEADVYSGMNTTNLKKGVASGVLRLVYGTLNDSFASKPCIRPEPIKIEVKPIEEVQESKIEKDEPSDNKISIDSLKEKTEVEPLNEKAEKEKSTKKSKTKKVDETEDK